MKSFTFSDFSTKFLKRVLFILFLPWVLLLRTALSSTMLTLMSWSLSITWNMGRRLHANKKASKNNIIQAFYISQPLLLSHLHVPTICLNIGVAPDKDVVNGEKNGEEGDGKDVDSHCEKSADFLLVV